MRTVPAHHNLQPKGVGIFAHSGIGARLLGGHDGNAGTHDDNLFLSRRSLVSVRHPKRWR